MLLQNLEQYEIILASKSLRRQELLHDLGLKFRVQATDIPEVFPEGMNMTEIPIYLAELKAEAFRPFLKNNQMVITADTIVWLDGHILNKPTDYADGFRMLKDLSGKKHQVLTGVCLLSTEKKVSFYELTDVWFKSLSDEEIQFYLANFRPYDKAGAYGIQEWIGYIGIYRIEGSFFNVMGLPVQSLYEHLKAFK
ncbi:MAG: Maf family nucleotide pyrophosphatase [Bacteroidota bacterium]|nr:septum formation protein Maf [Odoribacter sp.]MDP3644201.1 Maf family nucleotide pyrophosphatase [Bacteroidota bacterium]